MRTRGSREPYGLGDTIRESRTSAAATPSPVEDFSTVDRADRTGRGYFVYPNGTIYEGEWERGERHGLGVCYYQTDNVYVGQFVSGKMEGEGMMLFATGEYFVGEWRNSSIYRGVFGSMNGEQLGLWEDGKQISSQDVDVPQQLCRGHATLFGAILRHVQHHFRQYGGAAGVNNPAVAGTAAVDGASFSSPPAEVFSHTDDDGSVSVRLNDSNSACPIMRSSTAVPPLPRHFLRPASAPVTGLLGGTSGMLSYAPSEHQGRAATSVYGGDEPEKMDLRAIMTQPSAPESIFVGASPSCNEQFSLTRFELRVFVFMFPFLSLPWVPLAPLRVTALEEEREFVVSGGTLSHDFDPPTISIAVIAVAVCCQVASIVIVACKVTLGTPQEGRLTLPEMVIPCVLWLALGLFCGMYNSYYRVPHALERLDRRLTPKLTAYAASVVDARASVCIYTWDDEGRGKVRNRHYRYRWVVTALIFGAMMSLSAPSTRAGMGHGMFGAKGFEMAAALLAFFCTFFLSTILSFYVLKITDMQREVRAKMRVLTEIAFLEQKSIMNPSTHLRQPFHLDLAFDPADLFHGFPGWYAARSIVLYSSTCANHKSRSGAMSVFTLVIFFTSIVALGDVFKDLAEGRIRSSDYYSTAHSYGFVVLLFWGILLLRYYYACGATYREMNTHQSIMDTASLYHRVRLHDTEASETIQLCRQITERHDSTPYFFKGELFLLCAGVVVILNVAGMAAITFQLGEVIYY